MIHGFSTKVIRWDITTKCNLACQHCYIPSSEVPDLDTSAIIRILKIALATGLHELNLSGREPTMRNDLRQIIDWCQSRNVRVNMVTNGTLLNKRILLPIVAGLSIISYSLDGPSATVHDRIRGHGNFERTVKNIKDCINYARKRNPHIHIGVSSTLTKYNYLEMGTMVELGKSLGIDFLAINPVSLCGSAQSAKATLKLQNDEISHAFNEICGVYTKLRPSLRLHLGVLPKEAQFLNLRYNMDLPVIQNGCTAGTAIYITPDGKAYPCYMLPPIAQAMPSLRRYLHAWSVLTEPSSHAVQRFGPFLDFIESHSQKYDPNCVNCEDKGICKPCPLLAEFDKESLRRCTHANGQIASLMPHLHDSLIPIFRENVICHIEDNKAITYLKRKDYESKKIFELSPMAKYIIEVIGDNRSIHEIRKIMAKKYGQLSLRSIQEQLNIVLSHLWKDRILDFCENDF